jgi:hypothetical protein
LSSCDCPPAVGIAVDNDVLLKAACYGLAVHFWTSSQEIGVLGAARFVLADAVSRGSTVRDKKATREALAELFARAAVLEPTDEELTAAAELEQQAQRAGLELDVGESQLATMVVVRAIELLDTGDKRAVRGLEALIESSCSSASAPLCGRVRCLEQLLLLALAAAGDEFDAIARAVCGEPDVDKTASICFSCYSGGGADLRSVQVALESYLAALRREAPRVLVADASTS